MKKKYAMTLLEVMIVIFIIGIIGSVVGYNMRGSLDKGKAFKTKQGCQKIYDIVELEVGMSQEKLLKDNNPETVKNILENSGLVKNPEDLITDGWGEKYTFRLEGGALRFSSAKYDAYCDKKGINPKDRYPWKDGK